MKNTFLLFYFLVSPFSFAQHYTIIYDAQVKIVYSEKGLEWFNDRIKDPVERRSMIEQNSNPPIIQYTFNFNQTESLTVYTPKINNSQEGGSSIIRAPFTIGLGEMYMDYTKGEILKNHDVYGKRYIGYDSIRRLDFKDTGANKILLGRQVTHAKAEYNNHEIEVWYDPAIPYAVSPDVFSGTPGVILEIKYAYEEEGNEIVTHLVATAIKQVKKATIHKPTKGQLVHESALEAIYNEANERRNKMLNNR